MLRDIIDGIREDWEGDWLSLILAVGILFMFSQGWVSPVFGYSTEQPAWAGAIIRNIYYPVYVCAFVLLALSWRQVLSGVMRTPILVALIVICAASYLWSVDPSATMRRFIAFAMTCLAGYVIAARFSWTKLIEVVAIAYLILIAGSFIMAILFPDKGRMTTLFVGAWRGVFAEKNNLGAVMDVGYLACVAAAIHVPKRRWLWAAAAAGAAFLVLMSTSKTSLLALILGTGAMSFIWLSRRGPILGIVLTWLAVCVLMALGTFIVLMPEKLFLLLGKDATLTGRTNIWEGIDFVMQKQPLTGYGYGVVWSTEGEWTPLRWITEVAGFRAYHAHSCWYEVWLATGYIGLTIWACLFAETWLKAFYRTYRGDGGYFALPFITIYSLMSLTESIAIGWNDIRWCLIVIMVVKLALPGDGPKARLLSDTPETKYRKLYS
ncbi:O-antigen ligase [Asticcacaulis sp. YBE204]|uniref:O-antigen ligase family protein n=1 Tax=Asticcacaulis sp. YBE204 TaxID=1282363 RepID=UPI0003C400E2|nr:O-antigen ligase [Asticcacaulis sp. YBE204]ESQ76927.1 polymerase [Asticcacaulis sp. YBE204]